MSSEQQNSAQQGCAPGDPVPEVSKWWYLLLGLGGSMDLAIVAGLVHHFFDLPDDASVRFPTMIVFLIVVFAAEPRTINQFAFMAVAAVAAGVLAMAANLAALFLFSPSTLLSLVLSGLFAALAIGLAGPVHRRLGIPLKRDAQKSIPEQPSKPHTEKPAKPRSDGTPIWPPHPEGFPPTGELPPWVTR